MDEEFFKVFLEQENEYIKSFKARYKISEELYSSKQKEIDDLLSKILLYQKNEKIYLKNEDFKKLKELSTTLGGFLTMSNRQKIYKLLLCYEPFNKDLKYYNTIWINKENSTLYYKREPINLKFNSVPDRRVINADVERSNINRYFNREKQEKMNKKLKEEFEFALNTLITFNNNEISYYQGYHDIAFIFFVLFYDDQKTFISLFQKFSELFLKENTLKQEEGKGFTFEVCLKFFGYILKKINLVTYNNILKYTGTEPTFVISYILCLFTHDIEDIFLLMRLIDYFIMNNSLSVFVLVGYITVTEVGKILAKNLGKNLFSFFNSNNNNETLNVSDFYMHFKEINFSLFDWEKLMKDSNNFLNQFNYDELAKKFIEENQFEEYYPLLKKEGYIEKMIKMNNDIYKNYVVPKVGFGLTNTLILLFIIVLVISIYLGKLPFGKK
jgi:hypothetical protein